MSAAIQAGMQWEILTTSYPELAVLKGFRGFERDERVITALPGIKAKIPDSMLRL